MKSQVSFSSTSELCKPFIVIRPRLNKKKNISYLVFLQIVDRRSVRLSKVERDPWSSWRVGTGEVGREKRGHNA